jgi:ABC-type nitrate/sulfonate/bicarbonate transport system substrate-binding protein
VISRVFLQYLGLEKQVKLLPTGNIDGILAALLQGTVAGGILSPPYNGKASQAGLTELVNGPKLGVPLVLSGVSTTRDYLKAKPDVVKDFTQGYMDAWRFTIDAKNEPAILRTATKWTKIDDALAKESYDYFFPAWAKDQVPSVKPESLATVLAISDNPKAKDAKPGDFYDNSLIQAAAGAPASSAK